MKHWAVVFGGPSSEHEISILTGLQAERVLSAVPGAKVSSLYWGLDGNWYLVPAGTEAKDYMTGAPAKSTQLVLVPGSDGGFFVRKRLGMQKLEITAALSAVHGGIAEGGGLAAIFANLEIPVTGGSVYAGAVGMDKYAFGAMMQTAGIPSLTRELLSVHRDPSFDGPYILKPRFGGSSIGIETVQDIDSARALARTSRHLAAGTVVEPYRPDLIDLNISFRTYPELEVSEIERPLRSESSQLYSYEEKYLRSQEASEAGMMGTPRELPANVPDDVAEKARQYAREVAEITGLTGIVRVDLLWDEKTGDLYVNEVNSTPGALSLYLWSATGRDVSQVLADAVQEVIERPIHPIVAGHGAGVALQAAGGIANKLIGL